MVAALGARYLDEADGTELNFFIKLAHHVRFAGRPISVPLVSTLVADITFA
jgi:hypothetical protein